MVQIKSNTVEIIKNLQNKIRETVTPFFDTSKPYAILDFPNQRNVGDNAIWLGQIAYFDEVCGRKPTYLSDINSFSSRELRSVLPSDGTIFIHGGGNLGDIWDSHQRFREDVLDEFKDYKIIQLPQSIHFSDPKELEKSRTSFNAHKDFTLLVRDRKSLKIAEENYTCRTILVPDMACYLGLLPRPYTQKADIFCLLRTDHEKKLRSTKEGQLENTDFSIEIDDWITESTDIARQVKRKAILMLPFKLGFQALNKYRRREFYYSLLTQTRFDRGIKMLCAGKYGITDRLHGHIISFLLDIPHVRLDNFYGKVSGFGSEWTHESNIIEQAETFETAVEKISEIKKRIEA